MGERKKGMWYVYEEGYMKYGNFSEKLRMNEHGSTPENVEGE